SAYANSGFETASNDIRAAIEAEYFFHYANGLDVQKQEFHANDQDSFHKAQLGDDVAFYIIDVTNGNPELILGGYVFPLLLAGKQVATVHTEHFEGKWRILNISNLTDLGDMIQFARSNIHGAGTIKLIDDRRYGVKSVYIQDTDGDRIIDLKSKKVSAISEFNQEIMKRFTERQETKDSGGFLKMGSASTSTITSPVPHHRTAYIFSALGMLCLLPVIYFIVKCKKSPANS
ncbi:MAG: hypothetical protein J7559_19735, partial [Cohnella sp.]|nr:hypothetical protein [Cohnella sp.]